jgi:hypothetical protein
MSNENEDLFIWSNENEKFEFIFKKSYKKNVINLINNEGFIRKFAFRFFEVDVLRNE